MLTPLPFPSPLLARSFRITINDLPVGRSVEETLRLVKAFQFFEENGEVCPANWDPDTNKDTIKADPKQKLEYFSTQK